MASSQFNKAGHSIYPANWNHDMRFEIVYELPHLHFKYQQPPKNSQTFPIIFSSSSTYADDSVKDNENM